MFRYGSPKELKKRDSLQVFSCLQAYWPPVVPIPHPHRAPAALQAQAQLALQVRPVLQAAHHQVAHHRLAHQAPAPQAPQALGTGIPVITVPMDLPRKHQTPPWPMVGVNLPKITKPM